MIFILKTDQHHQLSTQHFWEVIINIIQEQNYADIPNKPFEGHSKNADHQRY